MASFTRSWLFLGAVVTACAGSGPGRAVASGCLRPPVEVPITRSFEAPPCRWCAGHRGLSYAPPVDTAVRAAAAGTVTFAGVVVDVRYVVIRHAGGVLATYGGLASATVDIGDRVPAGAVVGWSGGELYFGLRTGPDEYIDPEPLLGEMVIPPYLVPVDGSPRRRPPEPQLRCDR